MSKNLMLDLEGVLIATAIPPLIRLNKNDYGVRPYAKQFVDKTLNLFDQVYLNTCVRKKDALKIMRDIFSTTEVQYYDWDRTSQFGKASNYEKFKGSTLIHVEDESIENKEAQRMIQLGYDYVQVKGWYPHLAWSDEYRKFRKEDKELLIVLDKINKILT